MTIDNLQRVLNTRAFSSVRLLRPYIFQFIPVSLFLNYMYLFYVLLCTCKGQVLRDFDNNKAPLRHHWRRHSIYGLRPIKPVTKSMYVHVFYLIFTHPQGTRVAKCRVYIIDQCCINYVTNTLHYLTPLVTLRSSYFVPVWRDTGK